MVRKPKIHIESGMLLSSLGVAKEGRLGCLAVKDNQICAVGFAPYLNTKSREADLVLSSELMGSKFLDPNILGSVEQKFTRIFNRKSEPLLEEQVYLLDGKENDVCGDVVQMYGAVELQSADNKITVRDLIGVKFQECFDVQGCAGMALTDWSGRSLVGFLVAQMDGLVLVAPADRIFCQTMGLSLRLETVAPSHGLQFLSNENETEPSIVFAMRRLGGIATYEGAPDFGEMPDLPEVAAA